MSEFPGDSMLHTNQNNLYGYPLTNREHTNKKKVEKLRIPH